jgi:hypothetical protein
VHSRPNIQTKGKIIMIVKKKFIYEGTELQIVERNEPLDNTRDYKATRVIAPNGGIVPVQIQAKDTFKKIIDRTVTLLDGFKRRGADVTLELTKQL